MVKTHIDVPNKQVYFEKINELANFFALTKGFGIVFCVADNFFFRKEVNRQIIERLSDKNIIVNDFLLEEENDISVVEQLKKLKLENNEAKGFIINNFDFLLANQSSALAAFNQSRDVLSKQEIPLVFWLNEENIRSLSKSAPDIYTFRSLPILEFKDIPDFQSEFFLQTRFSEEYRTTEDYEKIRLKIELLERQLEEAEVQGYPKGKIIDQIVIPLYYSYGDIDLFEKIKRIFQKYEENLDVNNIRHLYLKFSFFEITGQFDKAIKIAKYIELLVREESNYDELALLYYNISKIYRTKKKFNESINFLTRAKNVTEKILQPKFNSLYGIYNELSLSHRRLKNYSEAETFQILAIQEFSKLKLSEAIEKGGLYNNLALVYLEKGDLKNAEKYQLKAISILENGLDDYHPALANAYHVYADILSTRGKSQKAYKFEQKASEIISKGNHDFFYIKDVVSKNIKNYEKKFLPFRNKRIKRNTPCLCGSNKKYKNCCINKQTNTPSSPISLQ